MSSTKRRVSTEALRELMDNPRCIRNMSVIAHVDHGKTTLTDSLLASNELIAQDEVGDKCGMSARPDEREKGITIKSTGVTLLFDAASCGFDHPSGLKSFLFNLIDSPGHVDFSSEVTAALRLTDGALVLVDCVEGICVQTETVLRQALQERIKPVLTINKLDRAFLELQQEPEVMYQTFVKWIAEVNKILSTYEDEVMGDLTLSPTKGNVAFSAGRYGWAFTLQDFAAIYSKKLGVSKAKMVEKLWNENYYDPETKKWTTSSVSASGNKLERGFCKFVLEPIKKVFETCMALDWEKLDKLLPTIGVTLTVAEREETKQKVLLKSVMKKWLPAADSLFKMMSTHLPSPLEAQKYRVENLYKGPLDDETAQAIRTCDPNGPLVMFVSKLIPTKDNSRFYAFGRVFAGTAKSVKVRIMGNNYEPGSKDDLFENKAIQRVVLMMGGRTEAVESVPCGNTCGLVGIDTFLTKSGTITTSKDAFPIVNMKYSVSPVVRVAVAPKNASDINKLVEALKRLSKTDPLVQCLIEATGEHIVACAGELHLEICLNDLREFMGDAKIVVSPPVVMMKETVTIPSTKVCLSKSPNNHNRIYARAEPLTEGLPEAFDLGKFEMRNLDFKEIGKKLVTEFKWDINDAKKIWSFGPDSKGPNVLVDGTKGVQYMNEIKDNVVAGFNWSTKLGVLAEEETRGVRINLEDAMLHSDSIHRGGGQIIPCTRRVCYAAQLTANPRLMEPVYLVEIQCPTTASSAVFNTLNQRRGNIFEQFQRQDNPLLTIKGYLPVLESFGFTSSLREATGGQAFPQLVMDHWEIFQSDPLEPGKGRDLVTAIRKRKGLVQEIPPLDRYLDKL